MENSKKDKNSEENNKNINKYQNINQNEDTYLELKESKNLNSSDQNNENEEDTDNNSDQNNPKKIKGILNQKKTWFIYSKLGNTFAFFGDKNGSPLIVIGPHWYMYICLSFVLYLLFYFFFKTFWTHLNIIFKLIGILLFLTFFLSYSYTSLINPGIPKYDENAILGNPRENYRFCKICGIWINSEEKTNHCYDCNVCYEGYDHHCPWTGNCIAKKNSVSFYIFIVSILCTFCYFVTGLTHAQHNIFIKNKMNK